MPPRPRTALLATLAVAAILATGSAHAEFAFRPEQAAAKLTATAKKLKAPFPFKHRLCVIRDETSCAFLAGSVVGMASGPNQGRAERVHLVYPPGDGTPTDMPTTWGILMALVSPEMAKDDRGDLALRFIRAATEPGFTALTQERGAVTYTISYDRRFGLMFTAASEGP